MLPKASVWPEALGGGKVWKAVRRQKAATRSHMQDCKRCARSDHIGENCVRRMLLKGDWPGYRNRNGNNRNGDSERRYGQRQVLGQQLGAALETAIAGSDSGDSGSDR